MLEAIFISVVAGIIVAGIIYAIQWLRKKVSDKCKEEKEARKRQEKEEGEEQKREKQRDSMYDKGGKTRRAPKTRKEVEEFLLKSIRFTKPKRKDGDTQAKK